MLSRGELTKWAVIVTSNESNLTKRPHRRRTWTVQSYSLGGANVHPIYTPSNTCFLKPTRVHIPNGISIGSAALQGFRSWQTDRQTDHATVTIGRIYTRSTGTAMQRNNTDNADDSSNRSWAGLLNTEEKPNSTTLASSELGPNMFEAGSCQIPLH